ncbi:MAG: hypothetical protein ACE5KT_12635 [Methanosarcinales archaeon]
MSQELLEVYDKKVIEKAKKYAEEKGLETLWAKIDLFESTNDKDHKSELYARLIRSIQRIDAMDQRIAQRRLARLNKKEAQFVTS